MVARPIVMLVLAGIDRPRAMTRTPSAAVRNAMTQRSVATRKSSGRLTRYTIQKLPVIWFPNDWTATSPRSSRYRNRWETRNGGGAGGAETIRAAPTHPRVQRDFAPSSAFHGRPRFLAIDSATRAVRRRAERSPRSGNHRFEQIENRSHALHVEPGRGRRDANPDGERAGRERGEQRLVRPVVAGRQDEITRFAGQMRRKMSAFVHPVAADLDDLVPRQDLKIEVGGQRGQDVDEVLRREGPGFHVRRAIVPRNREVFLLEERAGDRIEEALHHRTYADLPAFLERERGPPLAVPAVADPGTVFRDERRGELPEPGLQVPPRSATYEHDVVRRIGDESLQDPHDAVVRERGLPMRRQGDEGPVIVEEQEPSSRLAVRLANLLPMRVREPLRVEILGQADGIVEALEEPHRPCPRVVAPEPLLHRPDSPGLLLRRHRERSMDRAHDILHVVRVHDEGLAHLLRCAGHLAEDQDAARLLLRGDVLLRDEVHPISKRRDDRHIALAIEGDELVEVELAVHISDRRPCNRAVSAVDAPHALADRPLEPCILGDSLARWHDGEEGRDLPPPLQVPFQESSERIDCFRDALRIVEAGDREQKLRRLQPFPQARDRTAGGGADRGRIELRDIDAEREHVHLDRPMARDDRTDPVVETEIPQG